MGSGTLVFFGIFFSEIHLFGCQSCQASMLIWHDRRCVEVLIYLRVHASRTPGQKSYPTYHNMLLQVLAMSAISDVGLAWIFINQWCTRTQTTQKKHEVAISQYKATCSRRAVSAPSAVLPALPIRTSSCGFIMRIYCYGSHVHVYCM